MRYCFIFFVTGFVFGLCTAKAQQQTYMYDLRKYATDSSGTFKPCEPNHIFEYFSVNGKYPESSQKLLESVRQVYRKPANSTQSGFITIRFLVNCRGETGWFDVFQVDDHYRQCTFEKSIVEQLTAFTKSLNQWKAGKWESEVVNYFAYVTFKINAGTIENIIP